MNVHLVLYLKSTRDKKKNSNGVIYLRDKLTMLLPLHISGNRLKPIENRELHLLICISFTNLYLLSLFSKELKSFIIRYIENDGSEILDNTKLATTDDSILFSSTISVLPLFPITCTQCQTLFFYQEY
jgi:hypothetical protein